MTIGLKAFTVVVLSIYLLFMCTLGYQDYKNEILIDFHAFYWLAVKSGVITFIVVIIGLAFNWKKFLKIIED